MRCRCADGGGASRGPQGRAGGGLAGAAGRRQGRRRHQCPRSHRGERRAGGQTNGVARPADSGACLFAIAAGGSDARLGLGEGYGLGQSASVCGAMMDLKHGVRHQSFAPWCTARQGQASCRHNRAWFARSVLLQDCQAEGMYWRSCSVSINKYVLRSGAGWQACCCGGRVPAYQRCSRDAVARPHGRRETAGPSGKTRICREWFLPTLTLVGDQISRYPAALLLTNLTHYSGMTRRAQMHLTTRMAQVAARDRAN